MTASATPENYTTLTDATADRGDMLTLAVHTKQVVSVTRETLTLVGTLGSSGDAPP